MDPQLIEAAIAAFGLAPPEGMGSPVPALMAALRLGHATDRRRFGWPTTLLRSARRSRIVLAPSAWPDLVRNQAFALHAASVAGGDPLFFLSHRDYLVRGLSAAQRVQAAAQHYHHETTCFTPAYVRMVYRGSGLTLWHRQDRGVAYEIRLRAGMDHAHEGGVSLVLLVGGTRVCVLSYAVVPPSVPGLAGDGAPVHLITRLQATPDRTHRRALGRSFDYLTPAHLCHAALQGILRAQGQRRLAAVAGAAQPAFRPDLAEHFDHAYDQFWQSIGGQRCSPRAFRLPVGAQPASAQERSGARRRRALARSGHTEDIERQACATLSPLLR